MENFDWSIFGGQVIEKAMDVIFGAMGGLIAAWLAYRFGIKSEIIKIKAEMNQSIEKDRITKQNEVISEIWSKAGSLMEKVSILTARLKEYPDFKFLSGEALDEFLQSSFLTERQRKELIASTDRGSYYVKAKNWHEYNETRLALITIQTYIQNNRIHVPLPLIEKCDKFVKLANDLLITYEIWLESKDRALLQQSHKELEQLRELVGVIEQETRSHLTVHSK